MDGVKKLLKEFRFRPCGFSGRTLLDTFPWAQLPSDFSMENPWWSQGFESPKRCDARIAGLMAELQEYPAKFGEGDVVVFVTHGGTIGDILYRVLLRHDPAVDRESA